MLRASEGREPPKQRNPAWANSRTAASNCVTQSTPTTCPLLLKQEFRFFSGFSRPRVRLSGVNLCYTQSSSIPGALDDPLQISSNITYVNNEVASDTLSKCVEFARSPDGMNLVLNQGTSSSAFVTSKQISGNSMKLCVKCADDSLEIVDFLSPKIDSTGRRNFKNVYPSGLFRTDALAVNVVPFGGDFHVACVGKSRILATTVLGTKNAQNLIENCRFYGVISYRKFKEEQHNRVGLGCIRCAKGYTGPVYNDPDIQYLIGQPGEGGFLDNCSTSITDFDSAQSTSYIGESFYKVDYSPHAK